MVSTKGRYALRAMVRLASLGPESYIPLRDLADQEDISEKYLEVIMKTLVKRGLWWGCGVRAEAIACPGPPARSLPRTCCGSWRVPWPR